MSKFLASGLIAVFLSLFSVAPSYADNNGVASMIHSLRAERGLVCMVGHFHYGNGTASSKRAKAVKAAIRHWSSFTTLEYGSDWGYFGRSANRSTNCEKVSRNEWSCKVKGRPCRKGGSLAKR